MPPLLSLFCTIVLAAHVTDVPQHLRIVQNANNLFSENRLPFIVPPIDTAVNINRRSCSEVLKTRFLTVPDSDTDGSEGPADKLGRGCWHVPRQQILTEQHDACA